MSTRWSAFSAKSCGSSGSNLPTTITAASVTNASAAQSAVGARSVLHCRTQTTAIAANSTRLRIPTSSTACRTSFLLGALILPPPGGMRQRRAESCCQLSVGGGCPGVDRGEREDDQAVEDLSDRL